MKATREIGMRWMELIRLRPAQGKEQGLAKILSESVKQIGGEYGLLDARVMVNASFPHDLALNLIWDTEMFERYGSGVALGITRTLKTFGLVEHSVWTYEVPQ